MVDIVDELWDHAYVAYDEGALDCLTGRAAAEIAALRAEIERLREAFIKPDREVLRAVCYGTVCYADEFEEILESYWEALK